LAFEREFWALLARSIMRRPMLFLATGCTLLIALALPAVALELTPGSISSIPASSEAAHGARLLRDGLAAGAVTPTQILVDPAGRSVAPGSAVRVAIDRLADELARDPEVLVVASGRRPPYVSTDGRYARVFVAGRHELGHPATRRFVRRLRDSLITAARFPDGVDVAVGGAPAQGVDFLQRAYRVFPWLVLAVLAVTYLVLMRAFRSLLLPLKAVLLNALTVAAVYGLLVVVFQWGLGADLLGLQQGEVEGWIPIFLFAVLFGLSMDYEVFLVMPMREAWDEIPDNERAVASGLERTGRVVTAAALIMVAAFSGFVFGSVAGLQQFGVGLTLGVLLDVTIVRMVLVPSLMTVLGRYNWWLPRRVARALRVAPSPL
jgi:RND superfamily putative drug exporter